MYRSKPTRESALLLSAISVEVEGGRILQVEILQEQSTKRTDETVSVRFVRRKRAFSLDF